MGKEINLAYFDFDGTLVNSPLPEPGKQIWSEYYNKPYPHIGWWGRVESMDPDVFTIKTRPQIHEEWKKYYNLGYKTFILTSRQPKFEPFIKDILDNNNVIMDDIFTVKGNKTKGERILEQAKQYIEQGYIVKNIVFFDDRMKEIAAVSAIVEDLSVLGIKIEIVKVESDATD